MTPDTRLAALRALAEKATPGPWAYAPADNYGPDRVWSPSHQPNGGTVADCEDSQHDPANAAFIAAANPAVVLSLLDALAAAEGECFEAEHDLGRAMSERDALAARLAGARKVLARVHKAITDNATDTIWCSDTTNTTACEAIEAWECYDREAGGEGRGT